MVNYIVSGIERSGTSMMMQLLQAGGAQIAFDDASRPADEHNLKGYYELKGGMIINRLKDGTFPLAEYNEKFIKITAYGLKFLPTGSYKIIYMIRNLDEVLDSMEKMSGPVERETLKPIFEKLKMLSIDLMKNRTDMDYIIVNYGDVVKNPQVEIEKINQFLGGMLDVESAIKAVDPKLHRNVRGEN